MASLVLTDSSWLTVPWFIFCFKMDAVPVAAARQAAAAALAAPSGQRPPLPAGPTCEVFQGGAVDPEAQHLLHRQVHGIIPAHGSAAAAVARVRSPLYRIAELGFGRRHGGDRGGGGRSGSPLPVPLLRLDVRLRCGKGRAAGWSVGPRRCGLC